jgi:hypothetical protein
LLGAEADLKAKNENYDKNVAALKAEYGEAYDGKVQLASRVIRQFVDKEKGDEIVKKYGNDPVVIKLLASVGESMSEEKLSGEGMGGGVLTPAQAEAEIKAIRADAGHPYFKATHPDHKFWVEKVDQLTRQAAAGKK